MEALLSGEMNAALLLFPEGTIELNQKLFIIRKE